MTGILGFTVSYATSGTTTTITNSAKQEPPGVLEPSDPGDPSNPTDPVPVIPSPTGPPNPPGIDVPPWSVPSSPLKPGAAHRHLPLPDRRLPLRVEVCWSKQGSLTGQFLY
ncbi:hypothetical protein [Dehalobacterium formicoaceticum]|uniref:hypothetical protein n=1 Tax=Dehalobacterium formicoaceticum TaxID=51515 RepID=UPI0012F9D9CA|nr:hypothetical protein [Dehalobacterium formicoaceticum]